jgi:hypothetical protein
VYDFRDHEVTISIQGFEHHRQGPMERTAWRLERSLEFEDKRLGGKRGLEDCTLHYRIPTPKLNLQDSNSRVIHEAFLGPEITMTELSKQLAAPLPAPNM